MSAAIASSHRDLASAEHALTRISVLLAPAIDDALSRLGPQLREPVQHHMAGGGKRVRAALAVLSASAAGSPEEVAIPGAVAVELVHNYSLVHDDIIDGDRERRHRPTVWAQFGVGHAIVAGDALATLSLQILLDDPTPERVAAAAALAEATQSMIDGQASDMDFETRAWITPEECLAMEGGKTGALLSCSASIGAILAGAPESTVEALVEFGSHLGVAFQAIDDVLGIWGEPDRTGKPVGGDLLAHKKSLPVAVAVLNAGDGRDDLLALLNGDLGEKDVLRAAELIESLGARAQVMAMADTHLQQSLAALESVPLAPTAKAELAAIARFVTARDR